MFICQNSSRKKSDLSDSIEGCQCGNLLFLKWMYLNNFFLCVS